MNRGICHVACCNFTCVVLVVHGQRCGEGRNVSAPAPGPQGHPPEPSLQLHLRCGAWHVVGVLSRPCTCHTSCMVSMQAHEYEQAQGLSLQEFFDSTAGRFKTPLGQAWAAELVSRRQAGQSS